AANDRVIVRPSGTEPKVKCYLEVIIDVDDREELPAAKRSAADRLAALKADIAAAAGLPAPRSRGPRPRYTRRNASPDETRRRQGERSRDPGSDPAAARGRGTYAPAAVAADE